MPYIALGLVALVLLFFLAKAFVGANPANLAQGLRWAGVGIAVLGIGALTVTGRVGLASFLVPIVYWLMRGWRPWARGDQAARPSPGQASSIRTAFLELTLDHDSGALSGPVLRGRFQGRRIESLGETELIQLWHETSAEDAQSAQLVETCLDRSFPDWRDTAAAAAGAPRPRAGAMSRTEALRILGLSGDPTPAEVTEAHHRLMMSNHPDRGGSAYLAAMINEAKQVLTGPR
ncbi:MAG: molecular chaperone DnaJ [Proteobacteria bacterium]|nr:molecular chaperone DnaJ [Pseudomonadota bacterium]